MINIRMYTINYYDNQVPKDIHTEAYEYLQGVKWEANYRHLPDPSSNPKGDIVPYLAKKTIYRATFGHDYDVLHMHTPIGNLFDYINENLFDNKFELAGRPIGELPVSQYSDKEMDDYDLDIKHQGCVAYMQAQPYETVKRTRKPHRDWDSSSLDTEGYYTITFVANLIWSPIWHAEMFFFKDGNNDIAINNEHVIQKQNDTIGYHCDFSVNMPGRVILHDSRALHSSRSTSVLAPELSQRIGFRVKLKEGESLV